jgi:hypothetical protein
LFFKITKGGKKEKSIKFERKKYQNKNTERINEEEN